MKVRPFRKEDIASVLAVRPQCFDGTEHEDAAAQAAYFAELFFGNPWVDDAFPSLVCEDSAGAITGFLGVVPRRMTVRGIPLRVAATTHFMALPSAGPLVALKLLRALFDGPQDLSVADVAGSQVRRLWERFGAVTIPEASLTWIRVLRPTSYLASRAASRKVTGGIGAPITRALDALVMRFVEEAAPPPAPARGMRHELQDGDLLACIESDLDGRDVRGEYDAASLDWLIGMMARRRALGALRRARIVDGRGEVLGWYVVYEDQGHTARVANVAARPGEAGTVLDHLLHDVWQAGCAAVSGRFESRLAVALAERRCLAYGSGAWTVVHARDRALLASVARADGVITRLDGEWWMSF